MTSRAFILFFTILSLVAVLHLTALQFHLYWELPWFDLVTHLLGGCTVVLGSLWLWMHYIPVVPRSVRNVRLLAVGTIIVIGIGWEVFEGVIHFMVEPVHWRDTGIDLAMDALGGLMAYVLFMHEYRNKLQNEN